MLIVVLTSYLQVPTWDTEANSDLQVVELFAGVARIARLASWIGLNSRAFDIEYAPVSNPNKSKRGRLPRSPMDLNGSAGIVFLGLV